MSFCNALAMEMDADRERGPTWPGVGARDATDRPPSSNGEWRVGDDGLEHEGTGYFIEREGVGRRRADGLWFWPLHMLEKAWCAPDAFSDAFRRAVSAYGLSADRDLEASFLAAARAKADSGLWGRVAREVGLREAAPEPIRLGEIAKVSAEVCRRNVAGGAVPRRGAVPEPRRRRG